MDMTTEDQPRLILASASQRRASLLAEAGVRHEVVVPTISEPDEVMNRLPPTQQAEALAYFKARTIGFLHPDALVLGADTIVVREGTILGKPADRQDARRMLRGLSGTRHAVITGVALIAPGGRRLIASDVTHVTMRQISDKEIEAYLDSGEWIGKAGAYAIQETADRFVENIEGSFSNIVGLPMELLERMLKEIHHKANQRRSP
jgi:septum formation protein